jgi:hypothetical protein
MSNDPAYDAEQTKMHARYRELLDRYTARPFSVRHTDADCEAELGLLEEAILAHPPMSPDEDGVWRPRKQGVLTESPLAPGALPQVEAMSLVEAQLTPLPEREWNDVIADRNRTPPSDYCPFTADQDGYGSCGMEGSVGGMMQRRVADGQEHVMLNALPGYGEINGGRDGGSNPADALAYLQKHGAPSQAVWPRSKGWRAKMSDEARQDALQYRVSPDGLIRLNNWTDLGTCLLNGFCVPFGYSGHWIFATDLISTTRLRYKNSWGADWGDNGFGTLSKNSVYWSYGVWAVTAVLDRRAA